jgi:hypothetical protein
MKDRFRKRKKILRALAYLKTISRPCTGKFAGAQTNTTRLAGRKKREGQAPPLRVSRAIYPPQVSLIFFRSVTLR